MELRLTDIDSVKHQVVEMAINGSARIFEL